MTIRFKVLLLTVLAVVFLAGAACIFSQAVVERSITEAELATVRHDARLAVNMCRSEIAGMVRQGREWASNPVVVAAAGGEPGAFQAGTFDAALAEQRVDLVVIVNNDGAVVDARSFGIGDTKGAPPESVLEFIAKDSYLRVHHHADSAAKGLAVLPTGVFLLVSVPVLPNEPGALIRGALLAGRRLEKAEFYHIAEESGFSVFHQDIKESLSPDFREAQDHLRAGTDVYVRVLGTTSCAAYTVIEDVYGQPALLLRLSRPRESQLRAFHAGIRVGAFALAVGALLAGLVMLALEITVVSRLRRLLREIRALKSAEHTFEAKVTVSGDDEIGKIGQGVHYLLSGLKTNRLRWIRAEKRLQTLLEVSPTPILFADPISGKLRRANAGALQFLGAKSRRDLHGRTVTDVLTVPGLEGGMAGLVARLHDKSAPMSAVVTRLDGTRIPVALNGRKMSLDDDELLVLSFASNVGLDHEAVSR